MIRAIDVVHEARRWIGTPYVHQGRTRHGVDCIGFIICVRNACEHWPQALKETRTYDRAPKNGLLLEKIMGHCEPLEVPEDGCVVLIRWPLSKEPSHVALHAGGHILHSYQRAKQVIETGYRGMWLRDTHSLWRLPGVIP